MFLSSTDFFKINYLKKIFQEYHQSFNQAGSKLFVKVIPWVKVQNLQNPELLKLQSENLQYRMPTKYSQFHV